jgi:hypothetical protein
MPPGTLVELWRISKRGPTRHRSPPQTSDHQRSPDSFTHTTRQSHLGKQAIRG